jgi:hypothetical protein
VNQKIKKQWKQPHFIVLIKGDRQETVLVSCKITGNFGTGGPIESKDGCTYGGGSPCFANCDTLASS